MKYGLFSKNSVIGDQVVIGLIFLFFLPSASGWEAVLCGGMVVWQAWSVYKTSHVGGYTLDEWADMLGDPYDQR